jgi:hypothetical protein
MVWIDERLDTRYKCGDLEDEMTTHWNPPKEVRSQLVPAQIVMFWVFCARISR